MRHDSLKRVSKFYGRLKRCGGDGSQEAMDQLVADFLDARWLDTKPPHTAIARWGGRAQRYREAPGVHARQDVLLVTAGHDAGVAEDVARRCEQRPVEPPTARRQNFH